MPRPGPSSVSRVSHPRPEETRPFTTDTPSRLSVYGYAAFFSILFPALLFLWANGADHQFRLPLPTPLGSGAIFGVGLALFAWAVAAFMLKAGKLPTNIDPSLQAVVAGPYRLMSDPIYVGFGILLFGAMGLERSSFGFWFAAPTVTLLTIALVVGYENQHRPRRVGAKPLLDWPRPNAAIADRRARASAVLNVLLIALLYCFLASLGTPWDFGGTAWLAVVTCLLSSLFVVLTQASLSNRDLRTYVATQYVASMTIAVWAFAPADLGAMLLVPAGVAVGTSIRRVGNVDRPTVGLAVTVFVVLLAGLLLASPAAQCLIWAVAAAAIGMVLSDVHRLARQVSERIANSWRAGRIGPIRIINYSVYAFAAGFVGVLVFDRFVGDRFGADALILSAFVLLGAAIWGQAVEFSGRLARLFGYFGALIGGTLGTLLLAGVSGRSPIAIGAGVVLCAPWVQAIGRLRCLVQGCCHGRTVGRDGVGLRYTRPESRVVSLAGLKDIPVYPTQLYSIYANIFLGLLLTRLALAGASMSVIVGTYLIVAGAARFTEEAFRGEPQTASYAGLTIYQWLTVAQVTAGMLMTAIKSGPVGPLSSPNTVQLGGALIVGLVSALAMGVDFPGSSRRFTRLTPD
jgi:protein-S-isoprenylcysteine O-methyltransferase Ste14